MSGNSRPKWRRYIGLAAKAALWLLGVAGIIVGLHQAFYDLPASAAAAGALGIACLAFSGLDEIRRLSALGVEIERFRKVQRTADKLVSRSEQLLNRMALALGILVPRSGRMMLGFSRQEQLQLLTDLKEMMREIKGSGETINSIEREIKKRTAWDIAHPIAHAINHCASRKLAIEREGLSEVFGNPIIDIENHRIAHEMISKNFDSNSFNSDLLEEIDIEEWSGTLKNHIETKMQISANERAALIDATNRHFDDLNAWISDFRIPKDVKPAKGWPGVDFSQVEKALTSK